MNRRDLLLLVLLAGSVPVLVAAMTIQMDSISADGMELRDLSCEVEQGGFLAPTLVVAALATHKAEAPVVGTCSAILLAGEPTAAAAAAAGLQNKTKVSTTP